MLEETRFDASTARQNAMAVQSARCSRFVKHCPCGTAFWGEHSMYSSDPKWMLCNGEICWKQPVIYDTGGPRWKQSCDTQQTAP